MTKKHKPIVLIILDGWGYREDKQYNAIANAQTPTWDNLWRNYPHTLISGSGTDVGLPPGQMGNSEVGHLHMGAGRLVPQDLMRIDEAIASGDFYNNPVLLEAIAAAQTANSALHIIGLLSPGGVHSHTRHIEAMTKLALQHNLKSIFVHAILDGRDTPPRSALPSIKTLDDLLKRNHAGRIATIIGRYYAMDRDQRFDRTQKAYDLYTLGKAQFMSDSAETALANAYERNESDEFISPTAIVSENNKPITFNDNDVVVFMNFRADRARQLTRALTDPNFSQFPRQKIPNLNRVVTLTEYADDINAVVAYPPLALNNVFGEYIANLGYSQLRIAETEKYAHVTFFFNGGRERPYRREDRILVPSPKVATYDQKPEMSAYELTDILTDDIRSQRHDIIICNFANPDMVGHSGDLAATIKAIEVIDDCLKKILSALKEVGGETIITSDHGNAELMFDVTTEQPHTAHTTGLVPFVYVGRNAQVTHQDGSLIDIAPTLLYLLGVVKPAEMTGRSLVKLTD